MSEVTKKKLFYKATGRLVFVQLFKLTFKSGPGLVAKSKSIAQSNYVNK